MSKVKKIFLCLLILLSLTLIFPLIVYNQDAGNLSFRLTEVTDYPLIGQYAPMYLFWGSVIFFILLIALFFFILFFPKKEETVIFEKDNGVLKIERKSIEHFVLAHAEHYSFMSHPKVKVKMTKNKMDIKVLGQLKNQTGLAPTNEQFLTTLKEELYNLLGIKEKKVKIAVELVDYVEKSGAENRVE